MKTNLDLRALRERVTAYLHRLERGPGRYAPHPAEPEPSLFGAIDAALIRVIIGQDLGRCVPLPERRAWAAFINSYQEKDGTYRGGRSHVYHTNGNVVSALAVLGMRHRTCTWPLYAPFAQVEQLPHWLEHSIDWAGRQWRDSQRFRGGPHMFYYSPWATDAWRRALLAWLDAHLDPATGRWRRGAVASTLEQHIGGASHIWPLYEHTGHTFPYPTLALDAILELAKGRGNFGQCGSFLNVDALHGIKVMQPHAPAHRAAEIAALLHAHAAWLSRQLERFWASDPEVHQVLAVCDSCGVLYQLGVCPDDVTWTDHFSNRAFYNSAAVIACEPAPTPNDLV